MPSASHLNGSEVVGGHGARPRRGDNGSPQGPPLSRERAAPRSSPTPYPPSRQRRCRHVSCRCCRCPARSPAAPTRPLLPLLLMVVVSSAPWGSPRWIFIMTIAGAAAAAVVVTVVFWVVVPGLLGGRGTAEKAFSCLNFRRGFGGYGAGRHRLLYELEMSFVRTKSAKYYCCESCIVTPSRDDLVGSASCGSYLVTECSRTIISYYLLQDNIRTISCPRTLLARRCDQNPPVNHGRSTTGAALFRLIYTGQKCIRIRQILHRVALDRLSGVV